MIKKNPYRIVIVDDHPIVRRGLSQLITQEDDLVVCGEAESGQSALELLKKVKSDLVIVDISLPGMDGIELIKKIKSRFNDVKILVVSIHDESLFAERALRAGAKGYIMKQEAIENIIKAIRKVLNGDIYISEKVSASIVKRFIEGKSDDLRSPLQRLSDRELEVLHLIGKGFSTAQIAEELHVSKKTVETYRVNIKEKLNLKTTLELVRYAIQFVENS